MSQTTSTGSATPSANTASQLQVARGTFTVDIKPAGEGAAADGVTLGRMSLNKKFEGDLLGTGAGEGLRRLRGDRARDRQAGGPQWQFRLSAHRHHESRCPAIEHHRGARLRDW